VPSISRASNTVPVLVLQMSRGRLHHGQLGIVRSLGRLGVPVWVFRTGPWAPVPRSRFVAGSFEAHFLSHTPEQSLEQLLSAGRHIGQRAILIPTDDVGAVFVNEHADALAEQFDFPDQPAGLARRLASKQGMYELCKQLGVPTPETIFPRNRADVEAFARSTALPVAVKAIEAGRIRPHSGAQSVFIAHSASELLGYYDCAENAEQPNLMLQEFIPGGAESVWMFNGYFDAHSDCLVGFTGQKLRQNPPYTGATTLGMCVPNVAVEEATCGFMKALGYRGILDIGWRFDIRDGQYKLLDANPRIGATFRLFVDTNGMDVARALYLDLTGQAVPRACAPGGRKWLVENQDVTASLVYWQDRKLTPGQWARSFRGVREAAWFARDDPLPFAIMCGAGVVRTLRAWRGAKDTP
jgi:D-aspartate ligase